MTLEKAKVDRPVDDTENADLPKNNFSTANMERPLGSNTVFDLMYVVRLFRRTLFIAALFVRRPKKIIALFRPTGDSGVTDQLMEGRLNLLRKHYANHPKKVLGFAMYLLTDPEDNSAVSRNLAAFGYHELKVTELFRKIIARKMVVLNIGANIGYYTLMAAALVGPEGRVYAFEPEPKSFELLTKSLQYNKFSNTILFRSAVTDTDGEVNLSIEENRLDCSSIVRGEGGDVLRVQGIKLDTAFPSGSPRVDVVLMDAERAEPLIVKGGETFFEINLPEIIMEFNPRAWKSEETTLKWLYERFRVYEVLNSPFLIRPISCDELLLRTSMAYVYLRSKFARNDKGS
jgi:FkbM family methyltransferase